MIASTFTAIFVPLAIAIIAAAWFNYLGIAKKAKAAAAAGPAYQGLAEEYRRLSDLAITSSEHVDLRLSDLSVRVDELRDQLDQLQRILKEVE